MIKLFTKKNVRKRLLFLCIYICTGLSVMAQTPAVTGVVKDGKETIVGATVTAQNQQTKAKAVASTDKNGVFTFAKLPAGKYSFTITFVGYEVNTVLGEVKDGSTFSLSAVLKESSTKLDKDVIVTGMMTRKRTSFTGAVATFSGEELKSIGNQNVIQSLKTLDPSFVQIENNAMGSNPNVLPTIELRGQTSISTSAIRDQFSTDPNQPLFILDGFETTLRTIVDLDMNTVASLTILKDASSTAIYGSRASNGVVVIETKKPLPGKIRISYTSDLKAEMPDLSSYNMMDATEKLQFEKLAGRYRGTTTDRQIVLDSVYNTRLKEVQRGVNTYWLSQPLQTGFSQRHSVTASGGDNILRYDVGANIKKTSGAMIGSKRDDWGANFGLSYRSGIFNISNRVYVSGAESKDSPYGKFSEWVKTNPYYRTLDASKQFLEIVLSPDVRAASYDGGPLGYEYIPNPFYNAALTSFSGSSSFNVQNNFQFTAAFTSDLRLQVNAQIAKNSKEETSFVSPMNTVYFSQSDPTLRGSYTFGKTGQLGYNVNASLTYAKTFAKVHSLTAYLRAEIDQKKNTLNGYTAVGFPNASNGNPAFAYGFESGATPVAANTITRRNSIVAAVNYSYDQRYNIDLNLNLDGSTAFGSNHRYAPYYSGGLSWNVYKEEFMKEVSWVNSLRLRANIGVTGNQNFGNVSQSVYSYYPTINSFGQGIFLSALGAPDLQQQKTTNTSLGLDAVLFKNRINLQFNAFQKNTDPLVIAITLPSSTGLLNYPFNAGSLNVKGIETTLSVYPIYKPGNIVWSLGLTGSMSTQKYDGFDNKLTALNSTLRNNNSLTRYRDGYSSSDIWAVPSLGIDPATGKEVFLKTNGQQTFTYDVNDQVVVGNRKPTAEGVFSTTLNYKGFTAGVFIRYVFGRDEFNDALYNKVENITYSSLKFNQDKRALYDRWQQPGDNSEFKSISVSATTPISSRFVQRENSFSGESINLGYEFKGKKWLDKAYLSALSFTGYSNDLFYASTIKKERGTDYPFARSVSMSIRATFK